MPDDLALSIVIPAFNEERRLPQTLAAIAAFLERRGDLQPAEVLVVDDGSRDRTRDVAAGVRAPHGVTFATLVQPANRGKGAAVRAGMAASRGKWVLICDADLATPIEEIDALLGAGADVAVASRAIKRELIARRQPLPRDLLGRVFNLFLRVLGLTSMRDTQCGFKLLRGGLARQLAAALRLDGFAFDIELLARARRMGATIAEVPARWSHVDASSVHPLRDGLRMARDSVRVRWWLWTGR